MLWRAEGRSVAVAGEVEAHVLERLRARDEVAFEALVSWHEREVFQLARRLLGNHEDALDATQETFLRAYRGLPSFRGQATLRSWVYGIALNVCRNRLTSAHARAQRRQEHLTWTDDDGQEMARPLPDVAPGPEQAAYGAELRRALERALATLAPDHREVLVLREMHGLEYEELAAMLGCALGTVKSRLARARASLRHAMEGTWP